MSLKIALNPLKVITEDCLRGYGIFVSIGSNGQEGYIKNYATLGYIS